MDATTTDFLKLHKCRYFMSKLQIFTIKIKNYGKSPMDSAISRKKHGWWMLSEQELSCRSQCRGLAETLCSPSDH